MPVSTRPSRGRRGIRPRLLGLALLLPSPAFARQGTPSPEDVALRAERAGLVSALDLGRELGRGARDDAGLRESIVKALDGARPMGRLALGCALAETGDAAAGVDALLPLLAPEIPEEVAGAAAALLGLTPFPSDPASSKNLAKPLSERLGRTDLAAGVRLRIAASLFAVGTGVERTRARAELRAFLRSEEAALRAEGALALAGIGDLDSARDELKRLAVEPTDRGGLARSYLKREEAERSFDRLLKKQREHYEGTAEKAPEKAFDAGDLRLLEEVRRDIQQFHVRGKEFTREELVAAAARGMLGILDPHSTFFSGEEFRRFAFDINPEYGGIGAFVRILNNLFTIVRPIYSGPAYAAGLRSGDKVLAVDGWDTRGHGEDEIIKRLKGQPGTPVRVKVAREGWPEPRDFTVVRAVIHVPVLQYELLPAGVGYVELINFAENSATELDRALADLGGKGMKGLVLDLRNNQGGLLKSAVEVASRFLPKGRKVVYTDGAREGKEEFFSSGDVAVAPDMPIVCLVNDFSASASEIVAGALQDHGRAKIVGEATFGKGSVQTLIPLRGLPDEDWVDENGNGQFDEWEKSKDNIAPNGKYDFGPRVKLTVARYFLPSGRSIHTETDKEGRTTQEGGIHPDELVAFARIPGWKVEELERLVEAKAFRKYVAERFDPHRELFVKLAEGDGGEWKQYPDFEEFYASLKTPLDRDEIRRWVRLAVRETVADDRRKVFPGHMFLGDYEEDTQLQRAVRLLLEEFGTPVESVPEYRVVFAKTAGAPGEAAKRAEVGEPR